MYVSDIYAIILLSHRVFLKYQISILTQADGIFFHSCSLLLQRAVIHILETFPQDSILYNKHMYIMDD